MNRDHGEGVVERVPGRPDRLIRHRRTSGDSWSMGFVCSQPGEHIVAPFDDVDADECDRCWGDDQ